MRHGETDLNASGVWQGHHEGTLSETGKQQAKKVADRVDATEYDVVIASDLERTVQTANALGVEFETDAAWREVNVGSWAGRSFDEVAAEEPETMEAILHSNEVRLGGAESLAELGERVAVAFDALAERIGEDGSALVVTHGGVVLSLAARHWGLKQGFQGPIVPPTNTSLSTFKYDFGAWRFNRYNDASHLGMVHGAGARMQAAGHPLLTFVRHGETDANVQQVWQGQGDWGLNETGLRQAARLAEVYSPPGPVFASPLGRAATTAQTIAGDQDVEYVDGLMEIAMGKWEGLTLQEVQDQFGDLFRRTFEDGEDLKRGETGENVAELSQRVRTTVDSVMAKQNGDHVTFVSHGSAIRSFVISALGGNVRQFRATGILPNTGLTSLVKVDGGYRLIDYGVAPHRPELGH